jgi:hypothetical protein
MMYLIKTIKSKCYQISFREGFHQSQTGFSLFTLSLDSGIRNLHPSDRLAPPECLSTALDYLALLATVQRHQNPGGPILSNEGQKTYLIRPVTPFAIDMLRMCVRIAAPIDGEEYLPSLGRTRRMGICAAWDVLDPPGVYQSRIKSQSGKLGKLTK